jgi:ribosome-associated translation inhibitor RaiA
MSTMNITIKATHHDLTQDMRELIEGKFSALDKLTGQASSSALLACEIDESIAVERAGAKFHAKGNLSVGGNLFRGEASSDTLEGAVDQVRDDLVREWQHAQGKKQGLMKRGGAALKKMLRMGN